MSGGPSVSPNDPRELFGQSRGSSVYSIDSGKDVYSRKRPLDARLHLPPPQAPMPSAMYPGSFQPRLAIERSYYPASDVHTNRPSPYSHDPQHEIKQAQSSQQFAAAAATNSRMGAELSHSRTSTSADSQVVSSPRAQRKTKGHVASACVPCKRAHLR
ncbi:hypothetical protein E4U43_006033, partial [Claviceps pusilla]